MRLKSIAIVINEKKDFAKRLARQIPIFLKKFGIKEVSPHHAQMLITIGGDGTILYHKSIYPRPIFAIGSSTSFICHAHYNDWKKELLPIIKHGFRVEKRALLSSSLDGKRLPDALNEVVIRNREHRILELLLTFRNKKFDFFADGVLFSTATGSSAYAYSCGGKEMPPLSKKFQIVAIAPYRRRFKPLIVKPDAHCKLVVKSTCRADAVIDGQHEVPVRKKCTLLIWRSKKEVGFVRRMK